MIFPLSLLAISQSVVTGILISVAVGLPIALFAWTLQRTANRQSSRSRFAVWYLALLAISFLPFLQRTQTGFAGSTSGEPSHSLVTIPSSWAVVSFIVWVVVASIALLRIMIGLAKLRRLRRNCVSVDVARLDPVLQGTLLELRGARGYEICVSDELGVPTAIGFFKPLIVLPSWVLQDFPPAELRPVLLHELAHVRRWDDWTNLLQKILEALLFFHPAVWWIEKRISLEREMACDEVVLAHTENPRAYAQCLLAVAERNFVRRGLSLAQAAVARMRQTSIRISQILNTTPPRTASAWKPASVLLAASLALSFVALPHLPEFVTFRDKAPASSAVADFKISSTFPVSNIQIASAKPQLPRRAARAAVFQTKATRSSTREREAQNIRNGTIVEAKLTSSAPQARSFPWTNTGGNGQAALIQTVFVIVSTAPAGKSAEFWTIDVWQLTVFQPSAATHTNLPAKKV